MAIIYKNMSIYLSNAPVDHCVALYFMIRVTIRLITAMNIMNEVSRERENK
jgi:hypothetical protein